VPSILADRAEEKLADRPLEPAYVADQVGFRDALVRGGGTHHAPELLSRRCSSAVNSTLASFD